MDSIPTVKELEDPIPCRACGTPTWSGAGVCFRCRRLADPPMQPVQAPPPVIPPLVGAQRRVALDPEGRMAEDIACRSCGYNLRGLPTDAACPECSSPVARSYESDLLRFSSPRWVRRLQTGIWLVVSCTLIKILLGVIFWFAAAVEAGMGAGGVNAVAGARSAVGTILAGLIAFGAWLLTSPDPSAVDAEHTLSVRRLARWCVLASVPLATLKPYVDSAMSWMGMARATPLAGAAFPYLAGLAILMGLIALVGYVAGLEHLSRLGRRVPAPSVALQTRVAMWGYGAATASALVGGFASWLSMPAMMPGGAGTGAGPPTMAGALFPFASMCGCFGVLGSLIFGIWTIVLLAIYADKFSSSAKAAEANWT